MSDNANAALVFDYFAHVAAGRVEEANALLHDQGTWWSNQRRTAVPIREFKPLVAPAVAILPLDFVVHSAEAFGDRVFAEVESFGTSADGVPYNGVYFLAITVWDGKFLHVREFLDTKHAADFLPKEFQDLAKH
jgi:ketosteroid isomerase-like protein